MTSIPKMRNNTMAKKKIGKEPGWKNQIGVEMMEKKMKNAYVKEQFLTQSGFNASMRRSVGVPTGITWNVLGFKPKILKS